MDQNLLIGLVVLAVVAVALYAYAPKIKSLLASAGIEMFEGSAGTKPSTKSKTQTVRTPAANGGHGGNAMPGAGPAAQAGPHVVAAAPKPAAPAGRESFADYASAGDSSLGAVPMEGAHKPQGCYPR